MGQIPLYLDSETDKRMINMVKKKRQVKAQIRCRIMQININKGRS